MNIVLILAFLAAFYNVKLVDYNSDYFSVQQTRNLKGIFTLIVLFHHLAIFAGVGDVYTIFINSGYINKNSIDITYTCKYCKVME
mgnify:CR=1 FL=1